MIVGVAIRIRRIRPAEEMQKEYQQARKKSKRI
jgi:hypothetical protein